MTFKIGDNTVSKKVTLEQLTAGLDPAKDKKKIDRITLIFNQYNTNTNGSSVDALDLDEQVALMNDLHRADGDGKGENFDGKVSGKGLKKAGLAGEYKAYRDFIEAYQRSVASDVNTYDLTFKDETLDGTPFIETNAVQQGKTTRTEFQYNNLSGSAERVLTTQSDTEGTRSFDPQGRLTRQVKDGTTVSYRQYDSCARNAKAGIITVRQDGVDGVMTVKLQEDGTYLNEDDNSHFRLNRSGFLDEFVLDDKNRITAEVWGENSFNYTYDSESSEPSTVTINQGEADEIMFNRESELYTSMNGEVKEYFQFDKKKRLFTQTDAPQPKEPPVKKHSRPTTRTLIKMTAGWRNQRVKPDADMTAKFNAMSKADEVLTELTAKFDGQLDTTKLLADLIKNNPSVFDANGIIYSDARWNRLDFPSDLTAYEIKSPV